MNGKGIRKLPIPSHFQPSRVGEVWRVEYQERASEARSWATQQEVAPASQDRKRVGLLIIDAQNTFCIPGFELYVGGRSGTGAVEDNTRLCGFLYRNLGVITRIIPTLDTHMTMQIFHPIFWVDKEGNHPKPAQTLITPEDVKKGVWRVNPEVMADVPAEDRQRLSEYALYYTESLQKSGKYPLMVWPYHAMLGGIGHALVSAVEEAVFFHGVARGSQARMEIKGDSLWTENYSVLAPEVTHDQAGNPVGKNNQGLIAHLLEYDAVIVAGQAKSHCVAWTVEDLLREIQKRDRALAGKVYLLEDCTSPVVIPGVIDFTDSANQAYKRFAEAGMHVVRSSIPIESWPGFPG